MQLHDLFNTGKCGEKLNQKSIIFSSITKLQEQYSQQCVKPFLFKGFRQLKLTRGKPLFRSDYSFFEWEFAQQ